MRLRQDVDYISSLIRHRLILVFGVMRVGMSFLRSTVFISMPVRMSTMSVVVEEEKAEDVRCESKTADDQHQFRIGDFLRLDESLDGFEEDG